MRPEARRAQSGKAPTGVITAEHAEYAERKAARLEIPRVPRVPRFHLPVRLLRSLRANRTVAVQKEVRFCAFCAFSRLVLPFRLGPAKNAGRCPGQGGVALSRMTRPELGSSEFFFVFGSRFTP